MSFNIESILIPAEKVAQQVGDFKSTADLSFAHKLISEGITERDQISTWGEQINRIAKEIKRIEKLRDFIIEPIKKIKSQVEEIRKKQASMFDPALDMLSEIREKLDAQYGSFLLKCKREDESAAKAKRDAEIKAAEEEAKKAAAANDFMATIEAEEKAEALEQAPIFDKSNAPIKTVKTATGSTSLKLVDKVRIIDIVKVPARWLLLNEKQILADYKSGLVTEVPGVEFYQEAGTYVR